MLAIKPYRLDFLTCKKSFYRGKNSRNRTQNTNDMIEWVVSILEEFVPNKPEGYRYNAQALYLNTEMLNELNLHVEPFAYLNYSPTTDNSLKDNELGIDLNAILTKDK